MPAPANGAASAKNACKKPQRQVVCAQEGDEWGSESSQVAWPEHDKSASLDWREAWGSWSGEAPFSDTNADSSFAMCTDPTSQSRASRCCSPDAAGVTATRLRLKRAGKELGVEDVALLMLGADPAVQVKAGTVKTALRTEVRIVVPTHYRRAYVPEPELQTVKALLAEPSLLPHRGLMDLAADPALD